MRHTWNPHNDVLQRCQEHLQLHQEIPKTQGRTDLQVYHKSMVEEIYFDEGIKNLDLHSTSEYSFFLPIETLQLGIKKENVRRKRSELHTLSLWSNPILEGKNIQIRIHFSSSISCNATFTHLNKGRRRKKRKCTQAFEHRNHNTMSTTYSTAVTRKSIPPKKERGKRDLFLDRMDILQNFSSSLSQGYEKIGKHTEI